MQVPSFRFVSASNDKKIIEWARQEDRFEPRPVGSHSDWVRDVAWAPNVGLKYEVIVSASESPEEPVVIWAKDKDWKKVCSVTDFQCAAWRVGWNPTGNVFTVSNGNNETRLYKLSVSVDKAISCALLKVITEEFWIHS